MGKTPRRHIHQPPPLPSRAHDLGRESGLCACRANCSPAMIELTRGRPHQRDGLARAARIAGVASRVATLQLFCRRAACSPKAVGRALRRFIAAPDRPAPLHPVRGHPEPPPRHRKARGPAVPCARPAAAAVSARRSRPLPLVRAPPAPAPRNPPPWACRAPCPRPRANARRQGGRRPAAPCTCRAARHPRAAASCQCGVPRPAPAAGAWGSSCCAFAGKKRGEKKGRGGGDLRGF